MRPKQRTARVTAAQPSRTDAPRERPRTALRLAAVLRAVVVCLALCAGPTTAASAKPDGVPPGHATMPDAAADVLAEALAARKPRADWESTHLEASRKALEALRRTPLPDPTRLERVRILYRADWTGLGWRIEGAFARADIQFWRIGRSDRAETADVQPSDLGAEIDEVLAILRAEREGRRVAEPGRITGARSFHGHGADTLLVLRAIWAAWIGRTDDARTIADAALATGTDVLDALLAQETRRWFARGACLLFAGAPRAEVLAVWEAAEPWAHQAPGSVRLNALAKDLRAQVADERAHPLRDVADTESLPARERAAYFVARFVEVTEVPYRVDVRGVAPGDPATRWSVAAVRLGRDAVPALLAALDDRRLTRAPVTDDGLLLQDIHRVQDVALSCLRLLANDQPSTRDTLSLLPDEQRAAAIAEVRAWWAKHGARSELERRVARLDVVDLDNLRRIEALDRGAVDGVAVLRGWAAKADSRTLVEIASELARRGDVSLLPRVREVAAKRRTWETTWYLLAHGDASDIRTLLAAQRAGRRRGSRSGDEGDESGAWPGFGVAAANYRRPEVVPLLVDVLTAREMTGSRAVKGASSIEFCAADQAIEALVAITGHACGYDPAAPAAERFAAIDRWIAWWTSEGAAAFAQAHPDLAELVVEERPADDVLDRALTSPLVVVWSSSVATARWSVPREDVRRLVASGAVAVRTSPDGAPEFTFSGGDAEAAWSAAARAAPDGAVPMMTVDLQSAWIDARGRLIGFERHGDAKVLRFDGRWTELSRPGPNPSWERTLPDVVLPGSGGAVLLVGQDGELDLLDDEGAVHAPTFAELARAHGERLRRDFRGVVVHRREHRAMLVVDGRDRVWWRVSHVPGVSVLDGAELREGPLPVMRKANPPYDRAIDAMAPLPGGGVAVFANQSSGAVVDVADGAIRVVASFPVEGLFTAPEEVIALPDGGLFLDGQRFEVARPGWGGERRTFLAGVAADGGRWSVSEWNSSNRSALRHVGRDGRERDFWMVGDDGAVDLEPDGATAAWVSSRTALRYFRIDGGAIVEARRLPLENGERSLRSAGPGRVWVLGHSGGTGRRTTLFCLGP